MNLLMFHRVPNRRKVNSIECLSFIGEILCTGLITPDSWKSYPVVIKPRANKKPPPTVVNKPVRREKTPDPVREQPSPVVPEKPIVEKPKPHRSSFSLLIALHQSSFQVLQNQK